MAFFDNYDLVLEDVLHDLILRFRTVFIEIVIKLPAPRKIILSEDSFLSLSPFLSKGLKVVSSNSFRELNGKEKKEKA